MQSHFRSKSLKTKEGTTHEVTHNLDVTENAKLPVCA
jgi:hypothetical protein